LKKKKKKKKRRRLLVITDGNTTFLEAYQKTGRIFNVTAVSDKHRAILLNYKTTPNVVIWSAVIASSSLPLMMKPSPLMEKLPNGDIQKFLRFGKCWADGSIQMDLPTQKLLEALHVKFTLCVQCNPHVFSFYFDARGTPKFSFVFFVFF
ncbi:triacylglycerol lipase, partial [Reticulomyxa filosa]